MGNKGMIAGMIHKLFRLSILCLPLFISAAPFFPVLADDGKDNEQHIKQLSGEDSQKRLEAIDALGGRGINATGKGAAAIVPLLSDGNKSVRLRAIAALGKIGQEAKSAVPGLIELLKDQDPEIRDASAEALDAIGSVKGREAATEYRAKKNR